MSQDTIDRIWGGFLGGAVGDALGEPIEFLSQQERFERWGPAGVREFVHPDGLGRFTDDTQMTLFTTEALILHARTGEPLLPALHKAYLRWLVTQQLPSHIPAEVYINEGFLLDEAVLHRRMGPGRTCLRALMGATDLGMPVVNDSKGCGGLMRVAPIGFWAALRSEQWDIRRTFTVASQAAQLTHGNPCGYLSAGCFAVLVREVCLGAKLAEALATTLSFQEKLGETGSLIRNALNQARDLAERSVPWEQAVLELGSGWVAEGILAIAVYLGLTAPDAETGIAQAANHPGDADSVGALAGQLLGAMSGRGPFISYLLKRLEGYASLIHAITEFVAVS